MTPFDAFEELLNQYRFCSPFLLGPCSKRGNRLTGSFIEEMDPEGELRQALKQLKSEDMMKLRPDYATRVGA